MARIHLVAAAALVLIAPPALVCAIANPASAQESDDHGAGVSDDDLRDFLMDRLQARRERRDRLLDRIQERRDLRSGLMDLMRERRDLRDEFSDMLGDRQEWRDRIRERISSWRNRQDDGDWRSRLRERIAERNHEGGNCYFLTRSLRAEDGDLLVIIRRRVCRD